MKISYNLFVFECFWSYIHYTLKAVLPLGITAFFHFIGKFDFSRGKEKKHTFIERMPGMVNQTIRNRDEKRLKNIESFLAKLIV